MTRTAVVAGAGDDVIELRVGQGVRLAVREVAAAAALAHVIREALWEPTKRAQALTQSIQEMSE